MNCPRCNAAGLEGKKYCAECGTPLDPELSRLEELVRLRVDETIGTKFRDQRLVAFETTEAIANRLYTWAKLFAFAAGIPLALLAVLLGIGGVRTYSDFKGLISGVEDQVKPRIEQAKATADEAQKKAAGAQQEANEAKKTVDAATVQVNRELASATGVSRDVQDLSRRISDLEKSTSGQISASSQRIDARVAELDQKIDAATKDIGVQEQKLASTNELVKNIFSKGTTEYFATTVNNDHVLVVPLGTGAAVYMLLKSIPIAQTIEIKWRVASEPRGSYFSLNGNAILFIWGDPIGNLKQNPLEVTYIPDPTVTAQPFKVLSAKNGHIYADGVQFPDLAPAPAK